MGLKRLLFGAPSTCEAATPAAAWIDLPVETVASEADKPLKTSCPGQFQDAFSAVKGITSVDTFDGMRFDLHKPITPMFAVNHSLWMGSTMLPTGSNYNFYASVMDANDKVVFGRITSDLDLDGRFHMPIGPFQGKLQLGIGTGPQGDLRDAFTATLDYTNKSAACQLVAGKGNHLGFSFNQAITPRLSLGMDAVYHEEQEAASLSYGGKYTAKKWAGTALFTQGMLQAQYQRKVSERVQLGTELLCAVTDPSRSQVSVGAEFNLKQSKYHCSIDGTGKIDCALETRILPNANLLFSGQLNHAENKHKFGFGIQMQAA